MTVIQNSRNGWIFSLSFNSPTVPKDGRWSQLVSLIKLPFYHGWDKMLIAQSANGITLIGPLSEVKKMIPLAQWMSLACRFCLIAEILSTGPCKQAL